LQAGTAVAEVASDPVAAYSAAQSAGLFEVALSGSEPAPFAIALRQGSVELRDVLERALAAVMADGTYGRILEGWGLGDFAYQAD
jgi:polar amino acid transport system substrate-binding protein